MCQRMYLKNNYGIYYSIRDMFEYSLRYAFFHPKNLRYKSVINALLTKLIRLCIFLFILKLYSESVDMAQPTTLTSLPQFVISGAGGR